MTESDLKLLEIRALKLQAAKDMPVMETEYAAIICNVSEQKLKNEARARKIACFHHDKFLYFRREDLYAWMAGYASDEERMKLIPTRRKP